MNLGQQIIRLIATMFIWWMIAEVLTRGVSTANGIWLAIILGLAATISTWRIWPRTENLQSPGEASIKSKRNNRISRLMNELDENEIDELADYLASHQDSRLVDRDH